MTLDQALSASAVGIAYTRFDPDQKFPDERVITVENPMRSGQWWVHEARRPASRPAVESQGWPMQDYRDAEAFCAYRLWTPRGAIWWPASAPLEVAEGSGGSVQL